MKKKKFRDGLFKIIHHLDGFVSRKRSSITSAGISAPPQVDKINKIFDPPPYLTEIILEQELLEKKSKYALLQHASWADK